MYIYIHMYLLTYIYHSLPRSLKRPVCTLTGTIGRPSASNVARLRALRSGLVVRRRLATLRGQSA